MGGKRIFITGVDGFIGSHLVENLVSSGYEVKALAQYSSFNNYGWLESLNKDICHNFEKIHGNVRDLYQAQELLESIINIPSNPKLG